MNIISMLSVRLEAADTWISEAMKQNKPLGGSAE